MNYIDELGGRFPSLNECKHDIRKAVDACINAFQAGRKLIACGNGGSASDADHLVGELMKGFLKKRPLPPEIRSEFELIGGNDGKRLADMLQTPIRALSLCAQTALSTAVANDLDPDYIFAQQTLGLCDEGDIFVGISTSGNAKNVHFAAITAKARGAVLIGLTGENGGKMNGMYDVVIKAPETATYKIQELHLPVYHTICLAVEDYFFTK